MNTKLTLTGAAGPKFKELIKGDFFLVRNNQNKEECVFMKILPQDMAVCVYSTNAEGTPPKGTRVQFAPYDSVTPVFIEEIKGRAL